MLPSHGHATTPTHGLNIDEFIPPAIRSQYLNIETLLCQRFGWAQARPFQVIGILLQLARRDGLIHSGTGSGKTAIAYGPYALEENSKKTTLLISPLIVLQSEMAASFTQEKQVPSVAINNSLGAAKLTVIIKEILAQKYRIVLISPESLLSHRIRDELLMNKKFKKLLFSIIIDEAHVIAFWGQNFRKKYASLHILRDYFPGVPILGLSATLTPRVRREVASSLHMNNRTYAWVNTGNERPDIAIIVRRCEHPMNSFRDLSFLFKNHPFHPLDIPKTFIFIDNKNEGQRAVQALNSFLPPSLSCLGIIRPFNARHSDQYRLDCMLRYKKGDIRILVCTDAAGMGCDLDDVKITIQWRVVSLSCLIQRWGRTCRGLLMLGLGILFAERAAFNYNPTIPGAKAAESTSKMAGPSHSRSTKEPLKKGGWAPKHPGDQPELRIDSPYEGALALVQTCGCRRKLWTAAFNNDQTPPIEKCCDSCNPELLAEIKVPKPAPASIAPRSKARAKGTPHLPTQKILTQWRMETWAQHYSDATWGSAGVLSDELIVLLSSLGSISDYATLKQLLEGRWGLWEAHGEALFQVIRQLDVPYTPVPAKSKAPKRKASEIDAGVTESQTSTAPAARIAIASQAGITSHGESVVPRSTSRRRLATAPTPVNLSLRPTALTPARPVPLEPQVWCPVVYPSPILARRLVMSTGQNRAIGATVPSSSQSSILNPPTTTAALEAPALSQSRLQGNT